MKKTFGVLGIVALLVIASIVLWPAWWANVPNLFGAPKACEVDPFDDDCLCAADEERIEVEYRGINRYFCEKVDKFIDPDSPGFEMDLEAAAEARLDELYPACTMKNCDQGAAEWVLVHGITDDYGRRIVLAECVDNEQKIRFASVSFNVDGSEINPVAAASCADYYELEEGSGVINVNANGDPWFTKNNFNQKYSYRADCGFVGEATGEFVVELPPGMRAASVSAGKPSSFLTATPNISPDGRVVTTSFSMMCGSGGVGGQGTVYITLDPESFCYDGTRFGDGQQRCVDKTIQRQPIGCSGRSGTCYEVEAPGYDVVECSGGDVGVVQADVSECDDTVQPASYVVFEYEEDFLCCWTQSRDEEGNVIDCDKRVWLSADECPDGVPDPGVYEYCWNGGVGSDGRRFYSLVPAGTCDR